MQKSTSKTVLVLKTEHSRCFEEAQFILKDQFEWKDPSNTMVEEANRIILQAEKDTFLQNTPKQRHTDKSPVGWFFLGMLASLGIYSLATLLLSLLI